VKFKTNQGIEWLEWLFRKPARYRQQGVPVFPLLMSPRDEPPPHVIQASVAAAGHNAHIDERGTPEFRDAVVRKLKRDIGVEYDLDREVIATNGALNATFIAMAGLLGAGDEIIIPTPQFYYWNPVQLLNAIPVLVPGSLKNGWAWDLDAIEAAVTSRTRAILYTNPCNPTGFAPDAAQLRGLGEIALKHDLVLIEDQAYEKFTHSIPAITSAASIPGLRDRTLIVYSFHKNYSLHGWRVGFLAGPAGIIEPLLSVAMWVNLRVNHISQAAASAALNGQQDWVQEVVRPYREGLSLLSEGLHGDPGITVDVPVMGGTVGYLNVDGLGMSSEDAAEILLGKYGIPTVPSACFGVTLEARQHVRIAFALAREYTGTFLDVVDALKRASSEIRAGDRRFELLAPQEPLGN
jgi:aspartate/methionine/tyrosine aminotransferase